MINSDIKKPCPLCKSDSRDYAVPAQPGEPRRCLSCGLVFVNSTRDPEDPVELYSRAYQGWEAASGMDEFHMRLRLRQDIIAAGVNLERVLKGSQYEAIAIIKKAYPQGCKVLDIGCGLGYFLNVLRKNKYEAYGLDVAEPVVEVLKSEGFPMWLGPIDSLPQGWVEPQVVTSFFALHHMPSAVAFIRSIREKFPDSMFIIGIVDALDKGRLPYGFADGALPRTYTWWGKRQLQLVLELGGYKASIKSVLAQPRGFMLAPYVEFYRRLKEHSSVLARWFVGFYYRLMPLLGPPGTLWIRFKKHSNHILAVSEPSESYNVSVL